jgi:hypothetical protein
METYVKTKHKNQGLVKDVKEKLHIGKKASDEEDDDGSSSDGAHWRRFTETSADDRLIQLAASAGRARKRTGYTCTTPRPSTFQTSCAPLRLLTSAHSAAREQDRPDEGAGLPHEGKDASQLSEQERYERGVALMRKAMTKGTRQETSGDAEDAQPGGDTDA